MGMIYGLSQASEADLERLHQNPKQIHAFLSRNYPQKPSSPPRPGLFARLFGWRQPEASIPNDLPATEPFTVGTEESDLDKAWHGLHFLFTETAWDGVPPASFLLKGGREIGAEDVGYGPASSFTPSEVRDVDEYLRQLDPQVLRTRFNPDRMMKLEIYPTIWDRDPAEDDTLGYLLEYFEILREFVSKTAARGLGLVVYTG